MLRDAIKKILDEYKSAKKKKISGHPLVSYIKVDFPELLYGLIKNPDKYKIEASTGYGSWAKCPWIAILNPSITNTVQSGFFPMYFFREDLSGAYLSLNQGITSILLKHQRNTKEVLRSAAKKLLDKIGNKRDNFPMIDIELGSSDHTSPFAYYAAANVCACFYDKKDLPSEEKFREDLANIMDIYVSLKEKYKGK